MRRYLYICFELKSYVIVNYINNRHHRFFRTIHSRILLKALYFIFYILYFNSSNGLIQKINVHKTFILLDELVTRLIGALRSDEN